VDRGSFRRSDRISTRRHSQFHARRREFRAMPEILRELLCLCSLGANRGRRCSGIGGTTPGDLFNLREGDPPPSHRLSDPIEHQYEYARVLGHC
jgi:hypothetical protein